MSLNLRPRALSTKKLLCNFCGKSLAEVQEVIAGLGVYICRQCTDSCKNMMDGASSAMPPASYLKMFEPHLGDKLILCSFCGRSRKEVKKLAAGPGVHICDKCIDLCKGEMDKELPEETRRRLPSAQEIPGLTNQQAADKLS